MAQRNGVPVLDLPMRFLVVALGALMLTACVTPQEMRARQALSDSSDCEDYGFEPGTDLYAQCRMNLAQNRNNQEVARQAASQAASMQWLSNYQAQQAQRNSRMMQTNCQRLFNGDVQCTTW
jgi:hypothetical protein